MTNNSGKDTTHRAIAVHLANFDPITAAEEAWRDDYENDVPNAVKAVGGQNWRVAEAEVLDARVYVHFTLVNDEGGRVEATGIWEFDDHGGGCAEIYEAFPYTPSGQPVTKNDTNYCER
jgi:hypothetical protein